MVMTVAPRMHRIKLRNTSIESSQLGFGCVSLTAHPSRATALRLLEEAYDAGITHFDTARLYGMGGSEPIVGEFLRGKRDRVTVTTKFGLGPLGGLSKQRRLINLARTIVKKIPPLERRLKRGVSAVMKPPVFNPREVEQSLEISLRELRTDYLDIYLLHEADLAGAKDEQMLRFLQRQIERGTVRYCGMGSQFDAYNDDAATFPELLRVFQFDNSAGNRNIDRLANAANRALITHSALNKIGRIREAAPALADRYSAEIGVDLRDCNILASLLLRYATTANPDGIVLFATTKSEHLRDNLRAFAASAGYSRQQVDLFCRFAAEATR